MFEWQVKSFKSLLHVSLDHEDFFELATKNRGGTREKNGLVEN